ncbi:MAG TPA: long-chain fatty acid--CoA ligase [Acidimicrobiia bacterium]|nr:long-chain fatty acid--CoA ligase [Acidimicrobiia bacterium]
MTDTVVLAERAEIDAIVEGKTIVDAFNRNAETYPDQPAIHWKDGDWQHLTWSEYRRAVHKAAAGLQTLGVGQGQFVAIMAGNRPEHVIADFAAVHAGATPVTIYSTLAANQIQYIADNSKATVAILEDLDFMKRWDEIKAELPNLRYIVLMSGAENYDTVDWVLSWDELNARGEHRLGQDPDAVTRSASAINPEALATLIYTSGTTGTPKGVMISHRNVVWTLESLRRAADLQPGVRMVSYLPLAHIAERLATHYLGTYLSGEVWYCPNLAGVLEYIQEARPTVFVGVPRVYEKFHARLMARFDEAEGIKKTLLHKALETNRLRVEAEAEGRRGPVLAGILDKVVLSKVRDGLGMGSVDLAITAAAPINPDLVKFFHTIGVPLFEVYGMSENTGPATATLPGALKIGSVGRPLPGVEVAIEDDGELKMRGGIVTKGYYQLDQATRETFDDEGWLHSGDLARIDDDGFVWIVGRKKEIIITAAGKNIAPAKLETLLGNHPLVSKACMIGDQRKFLSMLIALDGEEAPAWAGARGLEYRDLASFSELPEVQDEIARAVDEANQTVARVEQVKKWVIVPDEWTPDSGEVTPSLKLKRRVVLDRYAEQIDSMYAGV